MVFSLYFDCKPLLCCAIWHQYIYVPNTGLHKNSPEISKKKRIRKIVRIQLHGSTLFSKKGLKIMSGIINNDQLEKNQFYS